MLLKTQVNKETYRNKYRNTRSKDSSKHTTFNYMDPLFGEKEKILFFYLILPICEGLERWFKVRNGSFIKRELSLNLNGGGLY